MECMYEYINTWNMINETREYMYDILEYRNTWNMIEF